MPPPRRGKRSSLYSCDVMPPRSAIALHNVLVRMSRETRELLFAMLDAESATHPPFSARHENVTRRNGFPRCNRHFSDDKLLFPCATEEAPQGARPPRPPPPVGRLADCVLATLP